MCAESFVGKLRQCQRAVHLSWGRPDGSRSDAGAGAQIAIGSVAQQIWRSGVARVILAGLLVATAIVAATYVAAETVADGAAFHSRARVTYATIQQQASANYRLARIHCQRLPSDARDTCIAKAHAEESRARAMASPALSSHVAAFRGRTDAAIDAGDRDAIVIEPACNVVLRGQAGLCEIQVRPGSANALVRAEMTRASASRAKPVASGREAPAQPHFGAQVAASRAAPQAHADSQARGPEAAYLMAAAASP